MSKKIKVAGYTKKTNYTDGISYRPFSTLNKSVSDNMIFGSGNFNVTVNTEKHNPKKYKTKDFSDYYTIDDIGIPDIDIVRELNKRSAVLNNDPKNIKNYAYFGSLKERVRVAVEQILMKFPAGIVVNNYYVKPDGTLTYGGETEYLYIDNTNGEYYITFNNEYMVNPYGISMRYSEIVENPLRNFPRTYTDYVIKSNDVEYPITNIEIMDSVTTIYFSSPKNINDRYDLMDGDSFYIVPNEYHRELFFNGLDNIQKLLLDRNVEPKYTYKLKMRIMLDSGNLTDMLKQGTWTTTDGYNLDFDSVSFMEYLENLIAICDEYDDEFSNILIRRMVSSSLLEFDTVSSDINENIFDSSQKIKSVLAIYGRSFDNTKNYIDSLAFANNVTYDKVDNAPDDHVREIAKSLGWDLFDTAVTGNWVSDNITKDNVLGMSNEEMEVELWRRLIMNSPYLFKTKGTRRALELLNKFLGIPNALININEFVYKVKNKLNYSEVEDIVNNFETEQTINDIPMDKEGFPKLPRNTENYYFQLAGGWYTKSGGDNAYIDNNKGNNPHVGEYDSGVSYLKPLKNMVHNFAPYNYERQIYFENTSNIFEAHYKGSFEGYPIGTEFSHTNKYSAKVEQKVPVNTELNDCGCEVTNSFKALTLMPIANEETFGCDYDKVVMDNGRYMFFKGVNRVQPTASCCSAIKGNYVYNYTSMSYICTYDNVLDCARFTPYDIIDGYHYFIDRATNQPVHTIINGECCPEGSIPTPIGQSGYKCATYLDVTDKCIYIKKITTSDVLKADARLEYIDSYYTLNSKLIVGGVYEYFIGDTVYFNTDINFYVNGVNAVIPYQEFINETGLLVESYQGHSLTFSNLSVANGLVDATVTIEFDYVDCEPQTDGELCFRLTELSVIPNESNANLTDFRAVYTSAVSNKINGLTDRNNNSIKYDLADGKFGTNVIRRTDILTLHNVATGELHEIVIDDIFDLPISTPYPGLYSDSGAGFFGGGYVRIKGQFVKCYNCYPYNTHSINTNTTTFGQPSNMGYLVFEADNNYTFSVMGNDFCCPYDSTPYGVDGGFICMVEKDEDCFEAPTVKIIDLPIQTPIKIPIKAGVKDLVTDKIIGEQIISIVPNTNFDLKNIFGNVTPSKALVFKDVNLTEIGTYDKLTQTTIISNLDLANLTKLQTNPIMSIGNLDRSIIESIGVSEVAIEFDRAVVLAPCDDESTVKTPCYQMPPLKVTPMPSLGNIKIPINVSSFNSDLGISYKDTAFIAADTTSINLRPLVGDLVTNKTIYIEDVVSSNIGTINRNRLELTNDDFHAILNSTIPTRISIGNLDRATIEAISTDRINIDFDRSDAILVPCDDDPLEIIPVVPIEPTEPEKSFPCYTMPKAIVKYLDDTMIEPYALTVEVFDSSNKFVSSVERAITIQDEIDLTSIIGVVGGENIVNISPISRVTHSIGDLDEKTLTLRLTSDSLKSVENVSNIGFSIPNLTAARQPNLEIETTDLITLVPCDTVVPEPTKPCLDLTAPISVVNDSSLSGFQLDLSVKNSGKVMKYNSVVLDRIDSFTFSEVLSSETIDDLDDLEIYPISSVSSDLTRYYNSESLKLTLSPSRLSNFSVGEISVPTYEKFDTSSPIKLKITDLIKPC